MRLLLDTHALLWWLMGSDRLPGGARDLIGAGEIPCFVSAASFWEISIKAASGKLTIPDAVLDTLPDVVDVQAFRILPITPHHAIAAGRLPTIHRDPFDRMLIAQAKLEEMTLVSNETLFDEYDVKRIW